MILVLAPFVAIASAAACRRYPAAAATVAFFLTGAYGSLQAFTGLSGALLVDLILVGLWLGLLFSHIVEVRRRLVLWLSILALSLYVALTGLAAAAADDVGTSLVSFRLSAWYLLAVVLLAYAGWSARVYRRIAHGVVAIGALVGAYAALRWQLGPAEPEWTLAIEVAGEYNVVEGELRVFGSFSGGHQLGFWAGAVAPFCLAGALGWKRGWRLAAGLAFGLLAFAVLLSEVRGGFVAMLLGSAIVLALFQLARTTPGLQLGRTTVIAATCAAVIAGGLVFTAGASDRLHRYTAILNPSEDVAYDARERKWEEAMDDIWAHPFGQGPGSASLNPAVREPYYSPAMLALDNSYLKVAYEQGLAVMALFVFALLALLVQISISSIRARGAEAAAMGIGAAGTLAATMVAYYGGPQYEELVSLGPWIIVGLGAAFLVAEQSGADRPPEREAQQLG